MDGKQTVDIVAIISAVIAFLSAIFAYFQANIAQKSYKLQSKIYEAGGANFEIQVIENSFLIDSKGESKIYYFFKIVLANLSDKATSIKNISLELLHDDNSSLIIDCQNSITIKQELQRLTIPNNINPHNSNSGWVVFKVERKIYDVIKIDTHFILAEDIHGMLVRKEEIAVREEVIGYDI